MTRVFTNLLRNVYKGAVHNFSKTILYLIIVCMIEIIESAINYICQKFALRSLKDLFTLMAT